MLSGKPTEAHTINEFKRQLEVFIELEGKLKTVTKQENYAELTYKRQVFWFFPPTFLYVHYKVYLILVINVRERQKKMMLFQLHYPKGPRNFTFTPLMDRKSEKKRGGKAETLPLPDLTCCEANNARRTTGRS